MTVLAYTDGASRGNPGKSGIGVILKNEEGSVLRSTRAAIGEATNNIAEYRALIVCLTLARGLGCTKLLVHSDSELMVRQLSGRYRVKDKKLQELYKEVRSLLTDAPFEFHITHVAREMNRDADRLANEGIDLGIPLSI
jgi:ribonuclease HI